MHKPYFFKSVQREAWVVFGLLAILYTSFVGYRPLATPDEGRYAEIPREMALSDDWVTPRLNGVKYFEKPPLMYWLNTLSIKAFGQHEWNLRLVTALIALLGCLVVYDVGRQLSGHRLGLLSALILALNPLYYALGQIIILDLPVAVFSSMGLFYFMLGILRPDKRLAKWWYYGAFAAIGLAFLTKGMVGFILPAASICLWALWERRLDIILKLLNPWGLLVFTAIAAPWPIMASIRNPGFAAFFFIHEHFERFLTTVHNRYAPFWFFVPIILLGFFPWICRFLAVLLAHPKRLLDQPAMRLLLTWSGLVFTLFSLSSSKLIPYIIIIFPALSLITAHGIMVMEKSSLRIQSALHVLVALIITLVWGYIYYTGFENDDARLVSGHVPLYGWVLCVLIWVMGVGGYLDGKSKKKGLLLQVFGSIGVCIVLQLIGPVIQRPSLKTLAPMMRDFVAQGGRIVTYHVYYQDLPFYINQTVGVVEWKGELVYGTMLEDMANHMMNEEHFSKIWSSQQRIWLVMRQGSLPAFAQCYAFKKIAETATDVVISNP